MILQKHPRNSGLLGANTMGTKLPWLRTRKKVITENEMSVRHNSFLRIFNQSYPK